MKELLNKRQRYYENPIVKYNLILAMRDREVVFMKPDNYAHCIRGLFIRNTQYLDKYFKEFKFFDRNYNIYVSVAKYKHIPVFTTDLSKRSGETSKFFSELKESDLIDYDIFIDFDMRDIGKFLIMRNQVNNFCLMLKEFGIEFNVYPSGNNYQVNIKNYGLFTLEQIQKMIKQFKKIFEFIDLKGSGVINKIRKCEYSLVYEKVCLPISNEDILKINYEDFDCNKVLGSVALYNRGLKYHNLALEYKEYSERFNRMLKKLLIEV